MTSTSSVQPLFAAILDAEHGPALDVMRAVKRALDPENRMNPGKMVTP